MSPDIDQQPEGGSPFLPDFDDGIYLFFDNEISIQEEDAPFWKIDSLDKFLQDMKKHFLRLKSHSSEIERQGSDLRRLSEGGFIEFCEKTKAVLFVPVDSFFDLESDLADSVEIVDMFRELISNEGLLFGVEIGDVSSFWTGASIGRWFEVRFPVEPEEINYAEPPSVLDLLYEFLEGVSHSQDNLLIFKETLLALPEEDRLFVENILSGENPEDSKETQETSARILRALMDRKV